MKIEQQKHVHFGSPLFASRKISAVSTLSSSSAVSPVQAPDSAATFRYLFHDHSAEARRSMSLDSFLALATKDFPKRRTLPHLTWAHRLVQALSSNPQMVVNGRQLSKRCPFQPSQDARLIDAGESPVEEGPSPYEKKETTDPKPSSSRQPTMLFVMGRDPTTTRASSFPQAAVPSAAFWPKNCRHSVAAHKQLACSFSADLAKLDQTIQQEEQPSSPPPCTFSSSSFEKKKSARLLLLLSKGLKSRIKSKRWSSWSSAKQRVLPTSQTFPPVSTRSQMEEEFNEDFVPRSYALGHPDTSNGSPSKEKIEIRRMSLKEFSGLDAQGAAEPSSKPHNLTQASPLMNRLQNVSLSNNVGNLLDKFSSNRRRSSAGLNKLSNWNTSFGSPVKGAFSGENLYDSFDMAIEGINLAISEATLNAGTTAADNAAHRQASVDVSQKSPVAGSAMFGQALQRIKAMKERLSATMKNIPNESPKKVENLKNEKVSMLNETRLLVGACKLMVRSTSLAIDDNELFPLIQNSVESADRVTKIAENLLKKRNSLFQAQLLTAKVDQVLKSLQDTISDLEASRGASRHGNEAKQCIRTSTSLAAALTQLSSAVQHF